VYREWLSPQTVAPTSMYPTMTVVRPHFVTDGRGWFLHDYAGESVAMHTGSIDGMSAIIGLLPDRRVGVYVLANADHVELRHALMYRVFDMYRGGGSAGATPRDWSTELRTLYGQLDERGRAAQRQQEQRRVANTRPTLALDRYAGRYTEPTYGDVAVTVKDGALQLTYGRGHTGRLEHWQYDSFRGLWADERSDPSPVVFALDGTGGVSSVRVLGVTFARVPSER
jgi:hypothetical protein